MLIYDRRYRSMTIQVAALLGFLLILSWLVSNTVQNLHALGKDFNFGFLWNRVGLRHQPACRSPIPRIRPISAPRWSGC